MTCLNGYYHDLFTVSTAEALMLNANGGAVGVWASSALVEPAPQIEMATELYRRLFAGARIGDAIRDAGSRRTPLLDPLRRSVDASAVKPRERRHPAGLEGGAPTIKCPAMNSRDAVRVLGGTLAGLPYLRSRAFARQHGPEDAGTLTASSPTAKHAKRSRP